MLVSALLLVGMVPHVVRAEVPFPDQIDRIIDAAHRRDGLQPAEPADDEEFVSRVAGLRLVPGTTPVEMPNSFVYGLREAHLELEPA